MTVELFSDAFNMKKFFLILAAGLFAVCAEAKVSLSPLFTDNMVLQQNCQAPVWGKAEPGVTVKVCPSWTKRIYSTSADSRGNWSLKIDTPKGSFKKHSVTISDGEPITIQNVLIGEVWLASGQSNMQMPVESWRAARTNQADINSAAQFADLRLLQVSRATGKVEHDYFSADSGGWTESSPESVRNFSAAGWYFGRRLMQELKVPVGIIHSSWGGTIIEAWMKNRQQGQVPALKDDESERERTFEEEINAFYEKVTALDSGPDGSSLIWKSITLPDKVQRLWNGTNGIFWFRKSVVIPEGWAGKEIILSLGPVDDFDETYWNGELVGSGRIWNKAREYTIPASLVKAGEAVICIRNTDDHGDGGLYGDATLLYLQGPDGSRIRLDDEWKVALSVSFEGMPKSTAREPNIPSVLYNAMIKPLAPFAIKGAIWYQGESNAEKAYLYREQMRDMILDWRSTWGYDFPFYITQIANYKALAADAGDSDWAELREAQAMATSSLDKVGMACIIDLGEAEDIHPVRKQEVGDRLALLALANDYGKKVACNGPRLESYKIREGSISVRFSDTAGGLRVIPSGTFASDRYGKKGMESELVKKAEGGELTGFQIAGADHVWHWADARISGDEVIVSCPDVSRPVAVRYGWAANPVCNLFNGAGLPAWPFRTDDWPGITYGKQ